MTPPHPPTQPRQPAGSPQGGQFTSTPGGQEATLNLGAPHHHGRIREGLFDVTTLPADLTDAELDAITDPKVAPVRVRALAAASPYAGVADRCVNDPHAVVRCIAATHWQVTPQELTRLLSDPPTAHALSIIVDAGLLGPHPEPPVFV